MVPLPSPLDSWCAGLPWAEAIVMVMAFVWGATIGSFVNVVAYRVPRGESVVTGGSRCPACGTGILPRDNIPVVGWLVLRGRCRSCNAGISSRYVLVELACGVIAAAVTAAELLGGGALPWLSGTAGKPLDQILMVRDLQPLAACCLHCGILILLVSWSLLGGGARSGRGAAGLAVCIVVAIVTALPAIGPPGIRLDFSRWPEDPKLGTLTASLAGVAAGWLVARLTVAAADGWALAVLGAAVGWQTVTVVAVVTALTRKAAGVSVRWPCPRIDPLPAVATAAIVLWRPLRAACMLATAWAGRG